MNLWLKIKIWAKVMTFSVIALYVLAFVLKNSGESVPLWIWFGPEKQVALLVLLLTTFLTGVIGTLLVRTIFKTMRQIREAGERGRSQKLEREIADMKAKAGRLQTRDRVESPRQREVEQEPSPQPSPGGPGEGDEM